jgi:hemin uptake protein HemP
MVMKYQDFAVSESDLEYSSQDKNQLSARILSSDILNGQGQIIIVHNREKYALYITQTGKLNLVER